MLKMLKIKKAKFMLVVVLVGFFMFSSLVTANAEEPPRDTVYFSFIELAEYKTILIVIDPKTGEILDGSKGAKEYYGYDELTALNIKYINQLSEQEVQQEIEKALKEERNYFNFVHKVASGELREVEVNSYPMMRNGEEVLFSRIIDVTDINEQELIHDFLFKLLISILVVVIFVILYLLLKNRYNSIRYQKLFENIKNSVAIYKAVDDGKDFMFIEFNPAAEKTEKIKKEELIGKNVTEVFPQVAEFGLLQVLQEVFKTGDRSYLPIKEYKDSRITGWRENYIYKLPHNELLVVYEDITESKQLQEQLLLAKEEAEKANKIKSEFLANMSHEIRTPLNGVQGFVELLLEIEDDETKKQYLEIVDGSAKDLLEIVESILCITKISNSEMQLKEKKINITKAIEVASRYYAGQAAKKGIVYIAKIDEKLDKEINVSDVGVLITINNLLANAIKFTDTGKITLEVTDYPGNYIKIVVSDTGIGIAQEKIAKLYEVFEQGEHYLTKQYGGTGLGLAITKGLIELAQGEIEVDTELGKGTTFTVSIPYKELQKTSVAGAVDSKEHTSDANIKVISAEDTFANQLVIEKFLESSNVILKQVADGQELIEELAKNRYDLILTDIQMPRLNGIEATKIIRVMDGYEKTPIIAVSAHLNDDNLLAIDESGVNDYISKPYKKAELLEKIYKWS